MKKFQGTLVEQVQATQHNHHLLHLDEKVV